MPKKIKTRKQKMLSDLRRKTNPVTHNVADSTTYSLPLQSSPSMSFDSTVPPQIVSQHPKAHAKTLDYRYLTTDLRKTILLTTSILLSELLIKFTIQGI